MVGQAKRLHLSLSSSRYFLPHFFQRQMTYPQTCVQNLGPLTRKTLCHVHQRSLALVFLRFLEAAVGFEFEVDLGLGLELDRGKVIELGIGGGVCSEGIEVGGDREVISTEGERRRAVGSILAVVED